MQKATRQQTKSHNKRLTLKTIYDHQPISRAEIARLTYLTRTTVSNAVGALMDEGLVAEIGHGPSVGGKPPIMLGLVEDSHHLIGLDLANSEFQGATVNLRGDIQHRVNLPAGERSGPEALDLVYQLIDDLLVSSDSPLMGIGIGTPGIIDTRQGLVQQAVNLGWQNLPLRTLLSERYHVPVYVANDSHVAAQAEYTFGQHKHNPNLLVIKVGRGIGAGLVLNNQLFYGDTFSAGEIGHVVVVENGQLCSCGNHGCLETVSSSRAILQQARSIAQNNSQSKLNLYADNPEQITMEQVVQIFKSGEDSLQVHITQAGHYLGQSIANLVGALNIKHILIAGSMSHFGEALLEPLKQEMSHRLLGSLAANTQIEIASLGPDIVILGAAALLLTQELGVV